MIPVLIIIGVVVLLAAGFYFTRDTAGAEDQRVDDVARRLTLRDDEGREV